LKGPAKFIRPLRGVLFDSVAFDPALSTSESRFIRQFEGQIIKRTEYATPETAGLSRGLPDCGFQNCKFLYHFFVRLTNQRAGSKM
jgi:hypothetical protein